MTEKAIVPEVSMTKTESSFGVITNGEDCHIVTRELGIDPHRCRQKGEGTFSKFSLTPAIAQYGLWEISQTSTGENNCLHAHISYFQNILGDKLPAIEKLRKNHGFECVFYVYFVTEHGGEGFDLGAAELSFISKVADRFTYSCVFTDKI